MHAAWIDLVIPLVSENQLTETRNKAIASTVIFLLLGVLIVYRMATRYRNPFDRDDGQDIEPSIEFPRSPEPGDLPQPRRPE